MARYRLRIEGVVNDWLLGLRKKHEWTETPSTFFEAEERKLFVFGHVIESDVKIEIEAEVEWSAEETPSPDNPPGEWKITLRPAGPALYDAPPASTLRNVRLYGGEIVWSQERRRLIASGIGAYGFDWTFYLDDALQKLAEIHVRLSGDATAFHAFVEWARELHVREDEAIALWKSKIRESPLADLENESSLLEKLLGMARARIYGGGVAEILAHDQNVTQIMINSFDNLFVERKGGLQQVSFTFSSREEMRLCLDRLEERNGLFTPLATAGSVPPVTSTVHLRFADGRTGRIGRIGRHADFESALIEINGLRRIKIEDYLRYSSLNDKMAKFLRILTDMHQSVLVVGNAGSGRTMLLSCLADMASRDLRLVHVGALPYLPVSPAKENYVFVPIGDEHDFETRGRIVRAASFHRPDVLIHEDCVGGEAWPLVHAAANPGPVWASIFANSIEQGFDRLEEQCMMASKELTRASVRGTVSRAFRFAIEFHRLNDGSRKIVRIAEIIPGLEGRRDLKDLFVFRHDGVDTHQRITGEFVATGERPSRIGEWQARGLDVDPTLFQ